jgi:cobalamin biosynthesis protein CbiG
VDLALVADVVPDSANVARDLGVMNVAGACALASADAILRVRQVR